MRFFENIEDKARSNHLEAGRLLGLMWRTSCTEYSSLEAHCKSFAPPFARSWQLLRNIARIAYSACIFIGALCTGNGDGMKSALSNIGRLAIASILEVLNIACSIISIVTRTMATLYNRGYTPGSPEIINVLEPGEAYSLTPEQNDVALHRQALTFI